MDFAASVAISRQRHDAHIDYGQGDADDSEIAGLRAGAASQAADAAMSSLDVLYEAVVDQLLGNYHDAKTPIRNAAALRAHTRAAALLAALQSIARRSQSGGSLSTDERRIAESVRFGIDELADYAADKAEDRHQRGLEQ